MKHKFWSLVGCLLLAGGASHAQDPMHGSSSKVSTPSPSSTTASSQYPSAKDANQSQLAP